jgi:hypothetical protein
MSLREYGKRILRGAGQALGGALNVVDLPGSMARDAFGGQNPVDQLGNAWWSDAGNRSTGRDMLRNWGAAGDQDTWGNWAGGMAAEVVTDPLNLIPGVSLAKHAGKLGKVKAANKAIDAGNALSLQQRAMGFMPEEIAKQTKIATEAGPTRMYHGTGHAFDQYDASKLAGDALYGKGIYTTDNPHIASEYVEKGMPSQDQIRDYYTPGRVLSQPHEYGQIGQPVKVMGYQPPNPDDVIDLNSHVLLERLDEAQANQWGKQWEYKVPPSLKDVGNSNVKMHYLDIRNPLNADGKYWGDDLPMPLRGPLQKSKREHVRSLVEFARDLQDEGKDFPGTLKPMIARRFAERNDVGMTGEAIYGKVGREGLPELGFDGVVHEGGKRMGTVPHNVAIAFDPSQVYKPYIAPALQNQLPLPPPPPPTLRALGAANLARGGRKQ